MESMTPKAEPPISTPQGWQVAVPAVALPKEISGVSSRKNGPKAVASVAAAELAWAGLLMAIVCVDKPRTSEVSRA